MKKIAILILVIGQSLIAQKQNISLEDIWTKNTFRTQRLEAFHSMNNGDFYTILNQNEQGTSLDKYDYATLEKVDIIVSGNDLEGIKYFDDYTFNKQETKLILGVDLDRIYRHSWTGKYYVYDLQTKKLELISINAIQEPTFSPDGKNIAFVYQNNLYVKNLKSSKISQITDDGEKNKIINGITDWVYEEEFSFVRAFQWNGTSDKIAFIRFDETDVPEFSMDIYSEDLYPKRQVFKYPKAGENNAEVSLHIYNLISKERNEINLANHKQYYIPRIKWTKEPNTLSVITLNRHQNNLNLLFVDGNTFESNLILNEKDAAFVDLTDDLTFMKNNSFIWTSEKDGFNHIYRYSNKGKLLNQITSGAWEVTNYYGFDNKTNRIFYQSTEGGSINRSIILLKFQEKINKN